MRKTWESQNIRCRGKVMTLSELREYDLKPRTGYLVRHSLNSGASRTLPADPEVSVDDDVDEDDPDPPHEIPF